MILALALLAQAAVATPRPTPAATPRLSPTPAPDVMQRTAPLKGGFGTPSDVARQGSGAMTVPNRAPGSATSDSRAAGAPTAAAPPPSGLPAVAGGGSSAERAWTGRMAAAKAAVAAAQSELQAVLSEAVVSTSPGYGPATRDGQPTGTPLDPDGWIAKAAREKAAEPYRQRVRDAERQVEAVREDCRRTEGCLPAWVR